MQKMKKMKDVFECRVEVGVWGVGARAKGKGERLAKCGNSEILEKHLNRLGLKERNFLLKLSNRRY